MNSFHIKWVFFLVASLVALSILVYILNKKKLNDLKRLERNIYSIKNDFLGSTMNFLLEKGPEYFWDVSKLSERVVQGKFFDKNSDPVYYYWIFGFRTEEIWGGYQGFITVPYQIEKSEVCVSIVIQANKETIKSLETDYFSKGYIFSLELDPTCTLYNKNLATCLSSRNNQIRIRFKNWTNYMASEFNF